MAFNPKDRFFHKAKADGFAARSVYKLQEIDQKFKVLKPGQMVLDLGCSPGSWSQYACQKIGTGRLLGVDLTEMRINLPNAVFIQADMRDLQLETIFREHGFNPNFDIVMSDMMSNTIGVKSADQARSMQLCELALSVAVKFLKPGGTFICKFFQSGEFGKLRSEIKKQFERVEQLKPESTRSVSKEIFIIGLKKKANVPYVDPTVVVEEEIDPDNFYGDY